MVFALVEGGQEDFMRKCLNMLRDAVMVLPMETLRWKSGQGLPGQAGRPG